MLYIYSKHVYVYYTIYAYNKICYIIFTVNIFVDNLVYQFNLAHRARFPEEEFQVSRVKKKFKV